MKTANPSEDEKLQSLLRGARLSPVLPPRFEENVWRRIEAGDQRTARGETGWLMALAGWLMKPKYAMAVAALIMLAGIGLGWTNAQQQIHDQAQARYLAAVAPNSLR